MVPSTLSNSTFMSKEASGSSVINPMLSSHQQSYKIKKKRNLPGNPDPDSEVIALSPKTLMATNRFLCEVCNKGFPRDQNLQLHRRGHNLPWKLKQRSTEDMRKKVYVCPEPSCVYNHPSRALGNLTAIKKHFCRKHGEKIWSCDKCQKGYAVQSDYKAHMNICGIREYKCDCGIIFTRRDNFFTHKAFCDALSEGSRRLSTNQNSNPIPIPQTMITPPPPQNQPFNLNPQNPSPHLFPFSTHFPNQPPLNYHNPRHQNPNSSSYTMQILRPDLYNYGHHHSSMFSSPFLSDSNVTNANTTHLSATAMLQATNNTIGSTSISRGSNTRSIGHIPRSTTQVDMDNIDSVARHGISSTQHMGFNPPNRVTTRQESNHRNVW